MQAAHVVPVFIHAPEEEHPWEPGAASRWWLHHSLQALEAQLKKRKCQLVIRRGPSIEALRSLIADTGATLIAWNRLYEPATAARDRKVEHALLENGVAVEACNSALLQEPWEISTQSGTAFRVFTPFWRACAQELHRQVPLPTPRLPLPNRALHTQSIASLQLQPKLDWTQGLQQTWEPGEQGAQHRLEQFQSTAVGDYAQRRDFPADEGTSHLSPHLHFGEIGPRQIVAALAATHVNSEPYLRQLGWREFAHHLLYHFPHTADQPLDARFANFSWREDAASLHAWQSGRTGIPLVDAGMRELWHTGWMHNRVRMIAASLLTKNLRTHWLAGARWFWDTLVDADLANNTLGWQWVAGCGADAAPYFRVFNPALQAHRYDVAGAYVRRWVPELAALPDKWLARPWEAPDAVLNDAHVRLGKDYPAPIVNLKISREEALADYSRMKNHRSGATPPKMLT